jgi:two-component system cell cycle sensor histidine kinase/response regulator CckA
MEQKNGLNGKKTLLVVDDDPTVLEFLKDALRPDFDVMTANTGEDAFLQAKGLKGTIHLLLTDFEMPTMNGIELATKLTALRPDIKVLLMSGFKGGMLVLNEGWHFLPKPFVASQLITLVNGLIMPPKSEFTAV